MVKEEIDIFERLKDQFKDGFVVKKTALKARNIYNKYSGKVIDYCMCTKVKTHMYAKQMLEWYESRN